ncbi:PaaI family thioesterase [Tautonia sociabilis]|uniref:PaaI family thioesterase n=1 Tax=Tautonia sociabilis TaxID=2080755 RepID=A0A432MKY1_9BACT|nr:PaaI family thioesterase [Tautonia sociabilis]
MPSVDDPTPLPPTPADLSFGGFWELLGMVPIPPARPDGPGRVMLRVGEHHLRSLGLMHGGVAAAMLDSFTGRAASASSPPGHHVVTIQLNVHFVRAARVGDVLIADGEVQHAGRRTAVVRGELRTEDGRLIATASGTFMHLPIGPMAGPDVAREQGAEA